MGRVGEALGKFYKQTDKALLFIAMAISVLSGLLLLGIHRAGYSNIRVVQVQFVAMGLGLAGAFLVVVFQYETLALLWKLYGPLVALLNLYTAFFGEVRPGTSNRSWLNLGFTSIQPSEFLKIALILTLAYHLSQVHETLNTPRTLVPVLLHGFGAVGIILLQDDLGVALGMAAIVVIMLFVAGISWKLLGAGVAAVAALAPVAWFFLFSPYHKDRILALFYPDQYVLNEAHQQLEGLLSIGSGQIFGIGIFSDSHNYVPELYNDFIFTFLGESLGFVGCFLLLVAYAFLCGRILATGIRCKNLLGRYICVGVFAMLASQIIINVGMCLMILPVIGVTLPLMSAGGSSVLMVYAGLGLVLSVYADNNKNMFTD